MKVPVSVLIPIYNEADNLARCLKSVSWADEIFVVDSGSTDGSQDIALSHGANLVQFKYDGKTQKKKNWSLDSLPFKHEWVFIIDADEAAGEGAQEEFQEICTTNRCGFDGYYINRRFLFMGKWLKHAYYPNWNLRLFKHKMGRFEVLTELPTGSGDVEIHEHVHLKGKAGYLRTQLDHYAFPTVEEFIKKHNRYSNWEAAVEFGCYLNPKAKSCPHSGHVGLRRRLKYLSWCLPCRPLLRFLYIYIIQRGFLDGREGYYFARLHAFYEFLCLCKIYELRKQHKAG